MHDAPIRHIAAFKILAKSKEKPYLRPGTDVWLVDGESNCYAGAMVARARETCAKPIMEPCFHVANNALTTSILTTTCTI